MKFRKTDVGRVVVAKYPFRVGLGRGPDRNGVCREGDKFLILDGDPEEIQIFHLSDAIRDNNPGDGLHSYTNPEHVRRFNPNSDRIGEAK